MKKFPSIVKAFLFVALLVAFAGSTHAQKSKDKAAAIKQLVEAQHYDFTAQSAIPMGGRVRQLTSEYDLKVTKTSITAYLPYFGRAYSAPLNTSDGGIKFTSSSFDYKVTPHRKGGWDVVIKPKDVREVQQLTLSISETGNTSLQVTSTNRQAISFSGYVDELKEKK